MESYYSKNKEKMLAEQNRKYKELSKIFQDWKGTLKCSRCGENDVACMEFHHTDPNQKEGNIIQMVAKGPKAVIRELKKCIVVCSNCHSKIHHYELETTVETDIGNLFEQFRLDAIKQIALTE